MAKVVGFCILCVVFSATMLLASLSFIYNRSDVPEQSDAVLVTFPELSEWDGDLLEMLRYKSAHCPEEVWIRSAAAKCDCDLDVVDGSLKLLGQSAANEPFRALMDDLSVIFVDIRTMGNRTVADQLVVTGALADFALDRAAILRGVAPVQTAAPDWPPGQMFGWIPEESSRELWRKRWNKIRDEDCRAYRVENCASSLDLAFSRVMNVLPKELLSDAKREAARGRALEDKFRRNFGGRRAELCLRASGGDYQRAYQTCLEWFMIENLDVSRFTKSKEQDQRPAPATVI